MLASRIIRSAFVLALAAVTTACTSTVDVRKALTVTDTAAGWYDAGIKDGKNKIVPMVTFRLERTADADLEGIAVNVVFRHVATPEAATEDEWDEVFVQNVRFTEGTRTPPVSVRTEKGYTGDPPQSRADLFKNSQFRDIRARVFAKLNSSQWVEVGAIDVPRQLLSR
jgi:hypothetical protein